MIPQPNSSFPIIPLKDIHSILFRKEVNHMLSSHCPRITKHTSQIGTKSSIGHFGRKVRHIPYSPQPGWLVFNEIKGIEHGEGLKEVTEIDRERVSHKIVRTFFKRNSSKSIKVTSIVSSQFLRESLISIKSKSSQFKRHTHRCTHHSSQYTTRYLSNKLPFKSSKWFLPPIIHKTESINTSSYISRPYSHWILESILKCSFERWQLNSRSKENT